jgi:hypothetical protein
MALHIVNLAIRAPLCGSSYGSGDTNIFFPFFERAIGNHTFTSDAEYRTFATSIERR